MHPLDINSEHEFSAFMERINAELASQDVPVHHRPIKGWFTISSRYGLGLTMPKSTEKAREGSYAGHDLSIRIFDWFDARYGDRLKVDWGPGETVIVIRRDAYRLVLPRVCGTVYAVCDRSKHGQPDAYPRNVLNVLDCIDDLQPSLCAQLSLHELFQVTSEVIKATQLFMAIEPILSIGFGPKVRADLRASVSDVVSQTPDYGNSRWHSLQAAEKAIKTYLDKKSVSYPTRGKGGHDLALLAGLASANGLKNGKHIRNANCSPNVRYEAPSTFEEACNAHWAARAICALVGKTAVTEGLVQASRLPCDLRLQPVKIV
jgi:hypothetical protein